MSAHKTLVVGAGAGGIQASLDLARAGFQVILAEASWHTGGVLSQLDAQFPTSSCGFCRMLPMADRDKVSQHCLRRGFFHDNIDLRLACSLVSLEGEPGGFTAALDQAAPLVDPGKCMGCGICETVCPVDLPDPFNQGLSRRRAVGRPLPQSLPTAYAIDPKACTFCGECAAVCPTGAITLSPGGKAVFKILVVDDEAIVRDSMSEWLGLEGYGVVTAESGARALERMEKDRFHLMLTDIKMPGMDGVELLIRAREKLPDLTVIMMTAYAEVDSAVNAMKEGALDYVTKPFEPEKVIGIVDQQYLSFRDEAAVKEQVDAVILATGTGFYLPDREKKVYGYRTLPNVVTALEFERMLSPAGPGVPREGQRIAWLQCVGSRDRDHGFCSSVCCMISIKQAMLAAERLRGFKGADIFYMDLRTPGKTGDAYRERARQAGVNFIRARIHSIAPGHDPGPVVLRYADPGGRICETGYDTVVLATGQAMPPDTAGLIRALELETDPWGFVRPPEFLPHHTSRPGIYTVGGLTGFKDIETTVTLGAAAAMSAAGDMAAAGSPRLKDFSGGSSGTEDNDRELALSAPRVGLMLCTCKGGPDLGLDDRMIRRMLGHDPALGPICPVTDLCTADGWKKGMTRLRDSGINRLVFGACSACISREKLHEAARALHLPARLIRGLDILAMAGTSSVRTGEEQARIPGFWPGSGFMPRLILELGRAVADLKAADPKRRVPETCFDRALVVGGGMAGMTCALSIAAAGFGVDLVEKTDTLGGHLSWIRETAEGRDTAELLDSLTESVSAHDRIQVHLSSKIGASRGLPGRWTTTLDPVPDGSPVCHGVVVLATGGREAPSRESGPGILTQKEFQLAWDRGETDPPSSLVMILCRGCREKEKNYCSRVCCPRALFQALAVMEQHPMTRIHVLYRDMMTPGNLESLYTRARESGIIFIPYGTDPPEITPGQGDAPPHTVACHDPVLGRDLAIEADMVVLATGVEPCLPRDLAGMFLAETDDFGFFKSADDKWRPVEGVHPRVLSCGLALKPCDLSLASATGQAAAMRAVGILSGISQGAAAWVRNAYCSLCLACIAACPFKARSLDRESNTIVVDSQACQGCGICAAVCPGKAAQVEGLTHYLNLIDHALASGPGGAWEMMKEGRS